MTLSSCLGSLIQGQQTCSFDSKVDARLLKFPDSQCIWGPGSMAQNHFFFPSRPRIVNIGNPEIPELRAFCKVNVTTMISGSFCTQRLPGAYLEFEKRTSI